MAIFKKHSSRNKQFDIDIKNEKLGINDRFFKCVFAYGKIAGFVNFSLHKPSSSFRHSRNLHIWTIFMLILSMGLLTLDLLYYIFLEKNVLYYVWALIRLPMFYMLQVISWVATPKLNGLLQSLRKMQFSLNYDSLKRSRSVFNEVSLATGGLLILSNGAYDIYQLIYNSLSLCESIVRLARSISYLTTFFLTVFHSALCYWIMYFLADVQSFIVKCQLEFCEYFNLIERKGEINMLIEHESNTSNTHNTPVRGENTISKYPSFLFSIKTIFPDNKRLCDELLEKRLRSLLLCGEGLLHDVEDAARLYLQILSYVFATISGK